MKHVFVIASLLFVQASALAQDRANSANAVQPEPAAKKTCWKVNAAGGSLEAQGLIHPATYRQERESAFAKAARSNRTI